MIKNVLYLASGVAIGYYVAHRRLEGYFNERLASAEDDAKEFYRLKYERKAAQDFVSDPEFMEGAIKAAEALSEYAGVKVDPEVLAEELTETFRREEEQAAEEDDEEEEPEEDEWDRSRAEHETEKELVDEQAEEADEAPWAKWSKTLDDPTGSPKPAPPVTIVPDQPAGRVNYNAISTASKEPTKEEKEAAYVPETIEKEAFINGDSGFEQSTLTYFAGDDVLANDRDQVITADAREAFLGTEIFDLLRAEPEARGGADAVYVRNTLRSREFEIVLSPGKYSEEVGEVVYATG